MGACSILDPNLDLLTEDDTAEVLHKSPKSLERWRAEGGGPPFVRVGKTPLYPRAALAAWLEGQSAASTSEERARKR